MQSALLELKVCAIHQLEFNDVWLMFGEGRHPRIDALFERKLAPFLSQTSNQFWSRRLSYFKEGLYYQGGMVGGGSGLSAVRWMEGTPSGQKVAQCLPPSPAQVLLPALFSQHPSSVHAS